MSILANKHAYPVLGPSYVAISAVADTLPERCQAELFPVAANAVLLGREGHPARVAARIRLVGNLKYK